MELVLEWKWIFAVFLLLGTFILTYTGKFSYDEFFKILLWIGSLIGIYEYGKGVGVTLKAQ